MVFFCQARLTKTLSKQRKDNYPQGNLRINWKSFFFSSFFSKQKKFHRNIFFFLFCNKSLWESFPAWKNKKEEKNVFVVVGHNTAFSPILSIFRFAMYSFISKSLFPLVETMGALLPTVYWVSSWKYHYNSLFSK